MKIKMKNILLVILFALISSPSFCEREDCEDCEDCRQLSDEMEEEYSIFDQDMEEELSGVNSMQEIYLIVLDGASDSEIKAFMKFIETTFPGYLTSLEKNFIKRDPVMIAEAVEDMIELFEEREKVASNPDDLKEYKQWIKMEQLEIKSSMISWEIINSRQSKTPSVNIKSLEQELHKVLEELFILKIQEEKNEVEEIEQELKEQKAWLQKRVEHKELIIKRRIETLTAPFEDELSWD